MNYLSIIEIFNRMESKIIQAKLMTYTKKFQEMV